MRNETSSSLSSSILSIIIIDTRDDVVLTMLSVKKTKMNELITRYKANFTNTKTVDDLVNQVKQTLTNIYIYK